MSDKHLFGILNDGNVPTKLRMIHRPPGSRDWFVWCPGERPLEPESLVEIRDAIIVGAEWPGGVNNE
jgi:hypothetical protein